MVASTSRPPAVLEAAARVGAERAAAVPSTLLRSFKHIFWIDKKLKSYESFNALNKFLIFLALAFNFCFL